MEYMKGIAIANLCASVASVALSSCSAPSDDGVFCVQDSDCQSICSPVEECVHPSTAFDVRVSWTINGQAPTVDEATICGDISYFDVQLEDSRANGSLVAYSPVPCSVGQVFYPNIPERLSTVRLVAHAASGVELGAMSGQIRQGDSSIQLRFVR